VQEGDRASRAPPETARDPVSGPRGEALGGGSTGARAISQPLPDIPEALRHRSIEIVAVARFKVAANGSAQVELTGPTADSDLNRALLESLRRWRFFPAMQDGKPVASTVEIRIPISVR
jgi:protein TonB